MNYAHKEANMTFLRWVRCDISQSATVWLVSECIFDMLFVVVQVTRQVAQCKCAKRFQVEQIGENKYRVSSAQSLVQFNTDIIEKLLTVMYTLDKEEKMLMFTAIN